MKKRPSDDDDYGGRIDRAAEAIAACLDIPPDVPERDMLEIRKALLQVVNRNVEAFLRLARTLTPDETKLLASVAKLTDEAIKDKRFTETRKDWDDREALEWLRQQMASPSEYQAIALESIPPEMILKRAREIENGHGGN